MKPSVEVKSRRVGGATYQVPIEVKSARQTTLVPRWLVSFSRARCEKTMTWCLMTEILDASVNEIPRLRRDPEVARAEIIAKARCGE